MLAGLNYRDGICSFYIEVLFGNEYIWIYYTTIAAVSSCSCHAWWREKSTTLSLRVLPWGMLHLSMRLDENVGRRLLFPGISLCLHASVVVCTSISVSRLFMKVETQWSWNWKSTGLLPSTYCTKYDCLFIALDICIGSVRKLSVFFFGPFFFYSYVSTHFHGNNSGSICANPAHTHIRTENKQPQQNVVDRDNNDK